MEFMDRLLTCSDCNGEFIFTAGEQLFFFDKQFKNDPKRCKPCKGKRLVARPGVSGTATVASGISRTETRTECSACGIETTVPFKPTQGRPVLCRQCFQHKPPLQGVPAVIAARAELDSATAKLIASAVSGEHAATVAEMSSRPPLA